MVRWHRQPATIFDSYVTSLFPGELHRETRDVLRAEIRAIMRSTDRQDRIHRSLCLGDDLNVSEEYEARLNFMKRACLVSFVKQKEHP
jgi:hypothetical protein